MINIDSPYIVTHVINISVVYADDQKGIVLDKRFIALDVYYLNLNYLIDMLMY